MIAAACNSCKQEGNIDHHPAMPICNVCKKSEIQCVKCAILILITGCEKGNKSIFFSFQNEIEEGKTHPSFSFYLFFIVSETTKFIENNKAVMYLYPVSIP